MRELDIYDIKGHDTAKLKIESRKMMNTALFELEDLYKTVLSGFADSDKLLDFYSLFDKVYIIFDFMYLVGMVNRFVYKDYMKILEEMEENVKGCMIDETEEKND